jgi:hypothetical protein
LTEGPHTFEVRATDDLQNPAPAPAARTFTVDVTPPETTIESGPGGATNDSSPSFAFSSSEPGSTFRCRLDSDRESDFSDCVSPRSLARLADGPHTFEVRAIDGAGNTEPVPKARSFSVDVTPPTVAVTSMKLSSAKRKVTMSFSSSEPGSTFTCRLDSKAPLPCRSSTTYTKLKAGKHSFFVYAADPVGNEGSVVEKKFRLRRAK